MSIHSGKAAGGCRVRAGISRTAFYFYFRDKRELLVRLDDGREVRYPYASLFALTHAYALSVHKAQGGEFPAVVIPLLTVAALALVRPADVQQSSHSPTDAPLDRVTAVCPARLPGAEKVRFPSPVPVGAKLTTFQTAPYSYVIPDTLLTKPQGNAVWPFVVGGLGTVFG